MWQLTRDIDGVRLGRSARNGLRIAGVLLIFLGAFWILSAMSASLPLVALLGVAGFAGGLLALQAGKPHTREVAAVISVQEVTGGTVVHVLDVTNQSHQILASPETVAKLTSQLGG